MNFDMYVVSQHKKGNKQVGFRILAIKPDDSVEIRDEEYAKVFAVASKGLIKNLKVENGKLKGVNGSLDRYAVAGKNEALVVLRELRDNNGTTVGYLCSDAEGRTRKLSQDQVIQFADRFGIANGKIVNDATNNKRYVSSIEGNYDVKTVQPIQKTQQQVTPQPQPQVQAQPQQQVQSQPAPQPVQAQQPAQQAPVQNTSNLDAKDVELINKVKANSNYPGSFAEKIIKTIDEKGFCSYNQRKTLSNILYKWENPSTSVGVTDEVKDLISQLKACKKYKGSFAEKLIKTIERRNECSDKQLNCLKSELEKLKKEEGSSATQQNTPAQTQNNTPVSNTTTQQNSAAAPTSNTQAQSATTSKPNQQNNSSTNQIPNSSNSTSIPAKNEKNDQDKLRDVHSKINKEHKDVEKQSDEDLVKLRKDRMTAKEKRAVDQSIVSDNIFDYSISKNGTAFIEGFKSDIEPPENVVTPETVTIRGKVYKVVGISLRAFAAENIKSFKASRNIKDIGQMCFEGCTKLETLDLSEAGHTLIPARMCKDCKKLVNINIGNFVEKIHEYAFYNTGLISITLSSLTTSVSQYAFAFCDNLVSVIGRLKVVDASAFCNCPNLSQFNFEFINRISTYSFRYCGFKELTLFKDTRSVGNKAFADNMNLENITIEEGVEEIGEYCFAKAKLEGKSASGECPIANINAPKSLKQIGYGAFRHAVQVTGYTGTQAESHCIANGVPFNALDLVNTDNSSTSRVTSLLIGNNPIETLKGTLEMQKPNASNPDYDVKNKRLLNVPLNDSTLATLGLAKSENQVDPHIKFKAALNYLQDIAPDMKLPLMSSMLRLQNAFYVNTENIFDDGCNKICKISYEMMDTLEKGEFILVTMNNQLVYMTDCNIYTDISMSADNATDDRLPIKQYLHVGDIIGDVSTISGHSGTLESENKLANSANVGTMFYEAIMRNAISVKLTNKDRYVYVPCEDIVLKLHDRTLDDLEDNKIKGSSEAIIKMLSYDEFLDDFKKAKKQIGGSVKFFEHMAGMSDNAVARRVNEVSVIGVEKEAQLFQVSKQFVNIVMASGSIPNPNMLTLDIFNELANSYWMISKDENWLRATGKKSLNQTAEYHIGDCKLTEYKSNQIVKFSNPYMNGKKGAYVYVLTKNNTCLGVYASRYTMHWITEKLFELTHIPSNITEIPQLMQNPDEFDAVNTELFYHFYSILENKNGHSFKNIFYSRPSFNNEFNISMYKPTGVFYITTNRFTTSGRKGEEKKTMYSTVPILPIGDMNHALIIATTTNSNTRNNKRLQSLLDELTNLSAQLYKGEMERRNGRQVYMKSDIASRLLNTYERYLEARSLAIQGVTDASQYRALIDDRIVFMMGAVHKGQLQREFASTDYTIDDEDDINLDAVELDDSSEEFEIEDDETIDFGTNDTDDIDIEDSSDEEDIDIDIDDEDDGSSDDIEMSFEEFFETAKSMGVTDESQARAMYINFMNQK